jgi:hypothetical protein
MENSKLIVNRILQVHEPSATRLGLDRLEEDRLVLAFGRWAEGQIKKWIDYAKGALLFVIGRTTQSPACSMCMIGHTRRFGWWTPWLPLISAAIGWRNSSSLPKRMA